MTLISSQLTTGLSSLSEVEHCNLTNELTATLLADMWKRTHKQSS